MKRLSSLIYQMFLSLKDLFKNFFGSITRGSSFIITTIGDTVAITASTGLLVLILLFLVLMSIVDLFTPGISGRLIPRSENI